MDALGALLPDPAPGREVKDAPAGEVEERADPKVAGACHQLGLIAQALDHSEAARSWHMDALRTAARLKDYGLCAKSAHQLAELCPKRDEAAAWSALALASVAPAPGPTEEQDLRVRGALAGQVTLATVERVWCDATGGDLPERLRGRLMGWLEATSTRTKQPRLRDWLGSRRWSLPRLHKRASPRQVRGSHKQPLA